MTDDANSVRDYLHRSIQDTTTLDDSDPDDNLDGAILLGWVTVAEWMHPTGDRWLSMISANTTGDQQAPDWVVQGYLHHALYDWEKEGE